MQYYHTFRYVILLSGAGYSRVTHPSAAKLPRNHPEGIFRMAPLDLHVLGTPPAFVLSQDQTLNEIFIELSSSNLLFCTGLYL